MHDETAPPPEKPRVVVVGARRRHQGLGAWLSRFVEDAGGRVVGIVGTSPETVRDAQHALAEAGIDAKASTDADRLVRDVVPDALVIASPSETHDEYLRLGLAHDLHVLCEKPLCWGGDDPAGRAEGYARDYVERGLHLVVNTQWPLTLPTYRLLHPGVLDTPPQRFAMRLAPGSAGRRMLPDALPHPLSLLLAVVPHPTPRLEDVRIDGAAADAEHLVVRFRYVAGEHEVDATVTLRTGREQPREAVYAFDGCEASRRVRLEDYRLWFEDGGRTVPLPDPTPPLVRSFVERVSSSPLAAVVDPNAWPGMALLQTIDAAWSRVKTP